MYQHISIPLSDIFDSYAAELSPVLICEPTYAAQTNAFDKFKYIIVV